MTDFNISDAPDFVAICGDWHGNIEHAEAAMREASRNGATVLIQVGDFGFGFDPNYVAMISGAASYWRLTVLFLDGNHENFDQLLDIPVREDGLRPVADNVFHLPRGFNWTWHGYKWLAAGGGYSVDKPRRTAHKSWWPQETITDEEEAVIKAVGKVDLLLTHDTDGMHEIPGTHRTALHFRYDQIELSELHRARISRIMHATRPVFAFHGHYHSDYSRWINETRTVVIGLDKDERPLSSHMVIFDTKMFNYAGVSPARNEDVS